MSVSTIQVTSKSNDTLSDVSSALSTQSAAIASANTDYLTAQSTNSATYQKSLVDIRATWRTDIEKVRIAYFAEKDRINSLGATKEGRSLASAALKTYIAALKKVVSDYKAGQPASFAARDLANKAALATRDGVIAKANATYATFIESIGYGVIIQ